MIRLIAAALLLTLVAPAHAQDAPSDPRIREIGWSPGLTLSLEIESGGAMVLMLPQGERIERAMVGEAGRFDVTIPASADFLFIRPLAGDVHTWMTVETDGGSYAFELHTGYGPSTSKIVRIGHLGAGPPTEPAATPPEQSQGSWALRGDTAVRPAAISDDGTRTFIVFAPQQALPAVFAIGPAGEEEVVDGYMRDGLFVIDRIHPRLVFRIDGERAEARRDRARG